MTRYLNAQVYHPPDGIAHATIGFAGIVGALTGISAAGVTVHEANLESNKDTFYGEVSPPSVPPSNWREKGVILN